MHSFYSDKVVLITGSTRGLGREMALQLLRQGARVIINGRSALHHTEVSHTFRGFESQYHYLPGDVSDPQYARQMVETAVAAFGKLDVLINNAAIATYGNFEEAAPHVIRQMVDTNLIGSLMLCRFAIPELKKTRGSILFVGSLAGIHGLGGSVLYCASKTALIAVAEALGKEMHPFGIYVGITYLGFTKNDEVKRMLGPDGSPVKVPARTDFSVSSQADSARLILNQIEKKKFRLVHSWLGYLQYYLNRLSPALIYRILLHAYLKRGGQ
jgi:NAD(P)-dependent dehydrogenase (short-subunit alcohol dehydrogenase family)